MSAFSNPSPTPDFPVADKPVSESIIPYLATAAAQEIKGV